MPDEPQVIYEVKDHVAQIQGMLLAFEHHFVVHQLGHAAQEAKEWNERAREYRGDEAFSKWLEFRETPFREQAEREY